jgi:uncharacterized protein
VNYTYAILAGVIIGTATRLYMLRTDYRQYPTYLHGKIIHIATGIIAAGLGTVAVPAILEEDFTAITFLTLAASQFREVRNMERNTLTQLDNYELVSRGASYIEGIALVFESRNYLVILTSFVTTLTYIIGYHWVDGIITTVYMRNIVGAILGGLAGLICLFIAKGLMSGKRMKEIVDIEHVPLRFEGAGLYIDNIYIMNIGLPDRQQQILKNGLGFVLKPQNDNVKVTLSNLGQRQAILHDCAIALGVYRDTGNPALVPLAKRDLEDGRLAVFILPSDRNVDKAKAIIGWVPVLENAIRLPKKRLRKEREQGEH